MTCSVQVFSLGNPIDMVLTMKLRLVVQRDPETGRWSAVFPELPGCASSGDTEEEAIENAREALALWFEPSKDPLPAGAKVVEISLPWSSEQTMAQGDGLEAIRAVREKISREHGNDPRRLVEHYMEYQKRFRDRLRHAPASGAGAEHDYVGREMDRGIWRTSPLISD